MKPGEIWKSKGCCNIKVRIDYIKYKKGCSDFFVAYTSLNPPEDYDEPEEENIISRTWFIKNFTKCRND